MATDEISRRSSAALAPSFLSRSPRYEQVHAGELLDELPERAGGLRLGEMAPESNGAHEVRERPARIAPMAIAVGRGIYPRAGRSGGRRCAWWDKSRARQFDKLVFGIFG